MNPYAPAVETNADTTAPMVCRRRWDVICIAALLGTLVVGSFVSLALPAMRELLMPRFGWGGLSLLLFPLNFVCLYLWKPAPRLLALAGIMCAFVAGLNALVIFRTGTVDSVANVFHDRLHSSYGWSVLPIFLVGVYLGMVAWRTRSHIPFVGD